VATAKAQAVDRRFRAHLARLMPLVGKGDVRNTIERWKIRIGRAAQLLSGRLDDPPSLQELAAAASLSAFHFHRVWRAVTGETVAQTILRLRLEASRQMLSAGKVSVTETAAALGFGTAQSFARAFRRRFGRAPSELLGAASEHPVHPVPPLNVEIITRGPQLVIALRREGHPYTDLNATFARVWAWAQGGGILDRLEGIYGIPCDDPVSVEAAQLRYDACLALGDGVSPPAPFQAVTLPPGPYARIRHRGSYGVLEDLQQRLVTGWLLGSGHEPADFPTFHHFLNDPDDTPPEQLATDILLPLR
jgi:AraC family transcriptional regulator